MSFVRSIVRLGSANVVLLAAQSVTIIVLGVIADPVAMGIYFLAQTTAQFVATFATLRLDSAFPAAGDRSELSSLLILAAGSIALAFLVVWAGVATLGHLGAFEFQTMSMPHYVAVGLLMVVIALQQLGRYWAIRHGQLRALEQATYVRAAAIAVLRGAVIGAVVLGGMKGLALAALLLGAEIALFIPSVATLFPRLPAEDWRAAAAPAALKNALKSNWTFPAIEAPSTVIDSGTQNMPIYLVTHFFGLSSTAAFGLAYRAMAVPVGQLALAVTEAMQSRYATWLHEGRVADMRRLFHRSSLLFAVLGAIGCVVAWFALEPVVIGLLGERMRRFAEIAVVLTPWIACNVLVNANSRLIPLLKRQDLKLVYDFTSAGLLIATWFAQTRLSLDLKDFVALMALGQAAAYLAYWLLIRHALLQAAARVARRLQDPQSSSARAES